MKEKNLASFLHCNTLVKIKKKFFLTCFSQETTPSLATGLNIE